MVKQRDISHFELLDWDFTKEDSRHFLHNICWYPSRYIPIIPAHLIQSLSNVGDTVLDPFCGAGTTILEALKLQRNAIGIELNPVGAYMSKTKSKILTGSRLHTNKMKGFNDYLARYQDEDTNLFSLSSHNKSSAGIHSLPNYAENESWYHKDTLRMLCDLYNKIESEFIGLTRDILRIIFISILMNSTGYNRDRNYAYYADNVKPKGEKTPKNAYSLYQHKLYKFIKELEDDNIKSLNTFEIFNDDARNVNRLVDSRVDLIVTSPPYLAVTDYTTAFRLAYLWYDSIFLNKSGDVNFIKSKEIGARWKRKQKDKVEQYLTEMEETLHALSKQLKKSGYFCLVIGESNKFKESVNYNLIKMLTENLPFSLINLFERKINKKFFIHPNGGGVQTEQIMIFQKGGS